MLLGEETLGHFELGGFDPDAAESVSDSLTTLLARPWLERSWLFRAQPRDASTSTTPITRLDVDLSTNGHKMSPTDAGYPDVSGTPNVLQFPQAIITPYSQSFGLGRKLWGVAETVSGAIVIDDTKGTRRNLLIEDWVGRDLQVYVGPRGGPQSAFGLVARLLSRQISAPNRWTLALTTDDYSFVFDDDLQTITYAGTGGLEGGSEIAGQVKPLPIGFMRQVEPVPVDAANRIYQVCDGGIQSIGSVDHKGVALVFDADYADIITATPAAGEYATSLATGYIRLGSDPSGVITCSSVEGYKDGPDGYVDDVAGITKLLTTHFGRLDINADLDGTGFTQLATDFPATMGYYFDRPFTVRQALAEFHRSAQSYAWLRPEKALTVGRITDPDLVATPDWKADAGRDDLHLEPWELLPFEIPVGRVFVGYRRYARRLSETDIDSSVTSIATRKDLGQEYRWAKSENTALLGQMESAQELRIVTNLDLEADAQALADEIRDLRSTFRQLGTFSFRKGLIARGIGHVVELTDDRLPVSPKKFIVLDVENEAAGAQGDDTVVLTVFG
jgi:hypothetical protein